MLFIYLLLVALEKQEIVSSVSLVSIVSNYTVERLLVLLVCVSRVSIQRKQLLKKYSLKTLWANFDVQNGLLRVSGFEVKVSRRLLVAGLVAFWRKHKYKIGPFRIVLGIS